MSLNFEPNELPVVAADLAAWPMALVLATDLRSDGLSRLNNDKGDRHGESAGVRFSLRLDEMVD